MQQMRRQSEQQRVNQSSFVVCRRKKMANALASTSRNLTAGDVELLDESINSVLIAF